MLRFTRFHALLLGLLFAVSGLAHAVESESAAPSAPSAAATNEAPTEKSVQVLVFADGDRVRGRLVTRDAAWIVFQSERFGELRVAATAARVITENVPVAAESPTPPPPAIVAESKPTGPERPRAATKPTPAPVVAPTTPAPAAAANEPGWLRWATPAPLAALLNDIFGSWHGRFSVASSIISGSSDTQSVSSEVKLNRKWKRDDVTLTARYDFGETNEQTTTDLLKANGTWRHQFTKRWFATYRPTVEWNRSAQSQGRAIDYLLLQQELGAGVLLRDRPGFKLRLGLAETAFDNWVLTDDDHAGYRKGSVFSELEWKLPWRITVTNRGNWYYSLRNHADGWENQFELGKKFSDTLSLSVRNDIRHQRSEAKIEDYELWRLLVGFDF